MGQIADTLESRGELDEALRIRREELPVYERLGEPNKPLGRRHSPLTGTATQARRGFDRVKGSATGISAPNPRIVHLMTLHASAVNARQVSTCATPARYVSFWAMNLLKGGPIWVQRRKPHSEHTLQTFARGADASGLGLAWIHVFGIEASRGIVIQTPQQKLESCGMNSPIVKGAAVRPLLPNKPRAASK
jgi:hypothetical protein